MEVREVVIEPLTGHDEGWVPEGIVILPTVISVKNVNGYALVEKLLDKACKLRCKSESEKIQKEQKTRRTSFRINKS